MNRDQGPEAEPGSNNHRDDSRESCSGISVTVQEENEGC